MNCTDDMTSLSGITIAYTKDKEGRIIRRYFKEQYPDYYINGTFPGAYIEGGRFFSLGTNESLPTPDNIIPSESRPEDIIDGRKFEVIDTQCECELSIPYEITGDLLMQHSIIEVRPPVFLDIYGRVTGFTGTIVVPSSMYDKYVSSNSYRRISGHVHTFDDAVYQWNKAPVTDYACVGVDKHYKEYYQVSYDSGTTWYNTDPLSSRTSSDVIEYNSMACGYIPPLKYLATYSDSHIESAYCDSSSAIVNGDITSSNLVSVEIGDCVTYIGGAFKNCYNLTSVTISNSVTSIGSQAFLGCNGLTSIDIPNSVTSIGEYAFNFCTSLTSCTIGSGVTNISGSAFYYCSSLTGITIPNSVTNIGGQAFLGCSGLTSITVENTVPPRLRSSSFDFTNNCPIYVPSGSVDTYKAASGWSNYASRIQAIT